MGRFKRFWARLAWKYLGEGWMYGLYFLFAMLGVVIVGTCIMLRTWLLSEFWPFVGVPLGILFLVIAYLMLMAHKWKKQLPEYKLECLFKRAKKFQESTPQISGRIDTLISASRASKDGEELKKWLNDYKEWRTITENIAYWTKLNEEIPELKSKAVALKSRLGI